MSFILSWLGSLIGGPLVKGALAAYQAKLAATNSADQHTADLYARELAVEQREAEVNADVVKAEQGNVLTRMVRPLFALPFIVFVWKVVVWDVVFGGWTHGSTDNLSPVMWQWGGIILTAYFAGRSLEKAASILKGR